MIRSLLEAAEQRRENISAPADRPSQRRCREEAGSPARMSARAQNVTVRAVSDDAGSPYEFEGFATVYERAYEMYDFWGPYNEIVSVGAASASIARTDLDVPLVLQHQDLRRIARTTNGSLILSESDEGLLVRAPELDPTDHDVQYIVPKLRAGLIDEMSFKFRITSGHWSPDYTEYRIDSFDLHRGDVAIVGYGANPHTNGAGLRAADVAKLIRELPPTEAQRALQELRSRAPKTGRDLINDQDVALRR